MGTMTEVVPASEAELVDLAAGTYVSILRSSREMLRLKFELGRLVTIHLQRHANEHFAVVSLARSISGVCGKVIVPQRLYEAARLYGTFGGELERVWALERRLLQPLTYTYLIRGIIPRVHQEQAWNPQEWELYQETQLTRLEHAVQEIELLKRKAEEEPPRSMSVVEADPCERETPAAERASVMSPAAGLLTICRDSEGYQRFRVATLVSTVVQSCAQLESVTELLTEDDRQRLSSIVPIVNKLLGQTAREAAA